ncbi:GBP2 [Symbiodinium natans]|uniref:GBP2 protein n=1 Tax=Symbiodinium natans TaxID=878477 RepID=A0A812PBN7_9DINO|nr:GBP2 [Symbiodinium natans]
MLSMANPGMRVEYYSASQANWIAAKVVAVKDGKVDLDCKADAALENIRLPSPPPGSQQLSDEQFEANEHVEYFGAKLQRWIPAKVLRRNEDGTFDLDCKPQVPKDRLRKAQARSAASSRAGSPLSTAQCPLFKEGDKVEYFSGSQSRWIPARVLGVTAEGNFNLDCKTDVAASKIRLPAKSDRSQYQVGDAVEYFGASRGFWIPTKVSRVNEDGTYDLACKPRVLAENIRQPEKSQANPADTQRGPVYNIGDMVEYFGASQSRWIPAKVVSMTPAGNYNLDVKQDVPVDRLRSGMARAPDRPAPGDPGGLSELRQGECDDASRFCSGDFELCSRPVFTGSACIRQRRFTIAPASTHLLKPLCLTRRDAAAWMGRALRGRGVAEGAVSREAFHRLEEARRRLPLGYHHGLVDLQVKQQELTEQNTLEAQIKQLRKEPSLLLNLDRGMCREPDVTAFRSLREQLEEQRREGATLELEILKAQIGASDKSEEAKEVKHEVETKTHEIVKALQMLSEHQQATFQHVATLTSDMLRACSQSRSPAPGEVLTNRIRGLEAANGHTTQSTSQPSLPSEARAAEPEKAFPCTRPSEEDVGELPWFQAMKANLEEFGDVEVFLEQQPQECMSCCQPIEADYRARPRKCSHVFHVECLLQCWSEGVCPVCGVSFAPEAGLGTTSKTAWT